MVEDQRDRRIPAGGRRSVYNDRIRIVLGGRISTGADINQGQAQPFIDNVSIEYRLDPSGTRYVKIFHNKDYESLLEGELTETGAGIVLLESPFGISESLNNQRLYDLLEHCMSDVRSAYPSLSVSVIGAPLIAVTNANQIKSDSLLAVSLSVVLILLILFYAFRKFF